MHQIKYSFKHDSLTLEYNKQFVCYHSYHTNNKAAFRRFKRTIELTQPQDLNQVYALAKSPDIASQMGYGNSKIIF